MVDVGRPIAAGLHQVDSPVFDAVRQSLCHLQRHTRPAGAGLGLQGDVRRALARASRRRWPIPTCMAFDPDGTVVRVEPFRRGGLSPRLTTAMRRCSRPTWALPVAWRSHRTAPSMSVTGPAQYSRWRETAAREFCASLPPSVAAFHMALGADGLYVTAPDALGVRRPLSHLASPAKSPSFTAASAGRKDWPSRLTARSTSSKRWLV